MNATTVKFITTFLFCTLYLSNLVCQNNLRYQDTPAWVTVHNIENTELEKDGPERYLLVDIQVNAIKNKIYRHYAIEILNSEGLQNNSTVTIDFDPTYQHVTIHDITIHRDGKKISKTTSKFNMIQHDSA